MRASLLASAIASMLRCSRFDACSIQGHRPRIAVLGRRTRTTCAACTNSVLMYLLPRLEILPRIVRSPVDACFGRWSRRDSTWPAPFRVELIVLHSHRSLSRDTIGSPNGRLRIFSIPPHIAATSMQDFRVSRHVAKQFHPARLSWSQSFVVKKKRKFGGAYPSVFVPFSQSP